MHDSLNDQPVLVTGAAGFIGFHLATRLLRDGRRVVGLDNLNDYYDVRLKETRLALLTATPNFSFQRIDIADAKTVRALFAAQQFSTVYHLAAQAGVRYSLQHPEVYVASNLVGFANILECCRHAQVAHLVYASSSSVYGANTKLPFSEHDGVDHPISLYAATKKSNEMMAHAYAHLFGLPCTGLRFFTVYGPWGRPDMALFLFAKAILSGQPIQLFNRGQMERDFTFIDDIVEGIVRVGAAPAAANPQWSSQSPDPATSAAPYRVFNIGNHQPVRLLDMVAMLEQEIGRRAIIELVPMQAGDVAATYADVDSIGAAVGFVPLTALQQGITQFVAWFRDYHGRTA